MDRIHRIGQYRPILITRLIIENSIESRILQLQEKKQAMVDSTIGKSFRLAEIRMSSCIVFHTFIMMMLILMRISCTTLFFLGNDPAALARLTPEDLRFLFVN